MNWDTMTDKERVRLVLEHVMGYFILEATATGWHTPEFPRGHDAVAIGFHWPIAFWNTDGDIWMTKDIGTDSTFFDPLRDMNDAWVVVRRMNNSDNPDRPDYSTYARFIDALEEIVGSNLFFDLFYCDKDGDHLTPERICKAALSATMQAEAMGKWDTLFGEG
jgi:hypothetical protein